MGGIGNRLHQPVGDREADRLGDLQQSERFQRSILENFFTNSFRETDGAIQFRVPAGPGAKAAEMPALFQLPFGAPGDQRKTNFFSAADGQFDLIAQVYRDWQISGDTQWLARIWPRVKKSLEFAWTGWVPP
jgi:hypothetical protein